MKTVPTWGYRAGESRIFDLPAGNPKLPEGWYDSPALIPESEKAVVAPAPPPSSLPSVDEQEAEERRRVMAENVQLRARVAELEKQLGYDKSPIPPSPPQAQLNEILTAVEEGKAKDGGPELTPQKPKKK